VRNLNCSGAPDAENTTCLVMTQDREKSTYATAGWMTLSTAILAEHSYLFVCGSVCSPVRLCLSVCLFVCLYVCLSVCLSVSLSLLVRMCVLSAFRSSPLAVGLDVCRFVEVSADQSKSSSVGLIFACLFLDQIGCPSVGSHDCLLACILWGRRRLHPNLQPIELQP
jgi:hypothetical protein